MGTTAAIGVGLQLLADALGVMQQLNAGQLTDAQALQLLTNACSGAQNAIDRFMQDTGTAGAAAASPAAPASGVRVP